MAMQNAIIKVYRVKIFNKVALKNNKGVNHTSNYQSSIHDHLKANADCLSILPISLFQHNYYGLVSKLIEVIAIIA